MCVKNKLYTQIKYHSKHHNAMELVWNIAINFIGMLTLIYFWFEQKSYIDETIRRSANPFKLKVSVDYNLLFSKLTLDVWCRDVVFFVR